MLVQTNGSLVMDIIDLPKYQQMEFIPLEHNLWKVSNLAVDEAELHYKGRVSPIPNRWSGDLLFGGGMSLVMRGVTNPIGRYSLSATAGSQSPYPYNVYNFYYLADSPPATVKPVFVGKEPIDIDALSSIDKLKYYNSSLVHGEAGAITKAYAQHAKYRNDHLVSKAWTWTDGNVQGAVYTHNRASWHAAEFMREELLAKINARQELLLDVSFIETDYVRYGQTYFVNIVGVMLKSWDEAAVKKAIAANEMTISTLGQVTIT